MARSHIVAHCIHVKDTFLLPLYHSLASEEDGLQRDNSSQLVSSRGLQCQAPRDKCRYPKKQTVRLTLPHKCERVSEEGQRKK
jgi:hypothetical protein